MKQKVHPVGKHVGARLYQPHKKIGSEGSLFFS